MIKQLKKAAKQKSIKSILIVLLDKLEKHGSSCAELLDSKLFLYELKNKRPPIRIYFQELKYFNKFYVLEYEMKTNEKKQLQTIKKLKNKLSKT